MTTRAMAAMARVAGPPDVIIYRRAEAHTGKQRSPVATSTSDAIDIDRGGKPYLIRFFRELR